MKLNEEEYAFLANYEHNFLTAIRSQWTSNPGENALRRFTEIWVRVTNSTRNQNFSCGSCTLHLVQDIGQIFFADKAERRSLIDEKNDAAAVVKTKKAAKKRN